MRYTTYEPQQSIFETRVKPSILSQDEWQIWLEFNRGMAINQVAKIWQMPIYDVNQIFTKCVDALRNEPAPVEPRFEPLCWEDAAQRRNAIIARFEAAPIVDGYKLIMSEL
jgi:hypothetical protein